MRARPAKTQAELASRGRRLDSLERWVCDCTLCAVWIAQTQQRNTEQDCWDRSTPTRLATDRRMRALAVARQTALKAKHSTLCRCLLHLTLHARHGDIDNLHVTRGVLVSWCHNSLFGSRETISAGPRARLFRHRTEHEMLAELSFKRCQTCMLLTVLTIALTSTFVHSSFSTTQSDISHA